MELRTLVSRSARVYARVQHGARSPATSDEGADASAKRTEDRNVNANGVRARACVYIVCVCVCMYIRVYVL